MGWFNFFKVCNPCMAQEVPHDDEDEEDSASENADNEGEDHASESDDGDMDPKSDSDSMGTTLDLDGRPRSTAGTEADESDDSGSDSDCMAVVTAESPFRCSQREGGDSWGRCYMDGNAIEELEMQSVPVETLYSWWVDGKVSTTEYVGTFSDKDVQHRGCMLVQANMSCFCNL